MQMPFQFDDGGRQAAGFKGTAGDCVARAIAIAAELPYREVYDALAKGNASQRASKKVGKQAKSARNGVYTSRKWFKDYMASLGFVWTPTMLVGQGCKVHMRQGELPAGRLVVSLSRHYAAVIDGTVRDTYDCTRDASRCVYGYWLRS